jgi:hypothetical protein
MKRFAFLLLLAGWLVPLAPAQESEHLQVGVFADYFRLDQTSSNFGGVGARVAVRAFRNIKLEAETSYDFDQAFTENFTSTTGAVIVRRSGMRILHGEFGPKVNFGEYHHIHPFVTVKGGFIDFRPNSVNVPATLGTFVSNISSLRTNNVNGVFYPGGGVEGRIGPVGLRFDIGSVIYINNGSHGNLRIAFGPYIRF